MVMLRDKLWLSIAKKEEFLCPECIEKRLGRDITPADFLRPGRQYRELYGLSAVLVNTDFAASRKNRPDMVRFLRRVRKQEKAVAEAQAKKKAPAKKKKEAAPPPWYDEKKLCRIRFAPSETGWAVDMGNGTYRLANNPIAAMCGYPDAARWGDLVRQGKHLIDKDGEVYSCLEVIERYKPETDKPKKKHESH